VAATMAAAALGWRWWRRWWWCDAQPALTEKIDFILVVFKHFFTQILALDSASKKYFDFNSPIFILFYFNLIV
jgi:hypothetical protein